MSQTIDFKLDSKDYKYQQLKNALIEKLKRNFNIEDYNPIVNYVVTYLNEVKRTKEETINEFGELFGDHSEDIVNWLWGYIEKNIPSKHQPEENKDLVEEIIQEKSDNHKIGSQIVNPNEKKEDKKSKNIFNSAIENIRDDKKKNYRKNSENKSEKDENVRTVKIGDKSIIIKKKVKRERSRENEREREKEVYQKFERKYNNKFDRNNNQREYNNNRGRGRKYQKYPMRKNYDNQQHYHQKEHKKYEENKTENLNLPQNEKPDQNEKDPNANEGIQSKKKIRCKNWPNCKKGEQCEFHHPTETCQFFPKCTFGNQCLNIHPNIPCKYGFYCTRIGCSYSHSFGYNPSPYQPFMQQGIAYPVPQFKNMKLDNTKKEGQNANTENKSENEGTNNGNDNIAPPQMKQFSQQHRPPFQNKQFFPNMKLVRRTDENNNPINNQDTQQNVSEVTQEFSHDVEMK